MTARAIVATALASLLTVTLSAQQTVDEHARRQAVRHYRAGQEAMAAEKFDRAAEEFLKATRKDRLFTLAYYFLGQAYGYQRRYPAAIKAYQDCVEACREISASVPANSTPVGPPPTTTKFNGASASPAAACRSANSNASSTRLRISSASSMVLSPGANDSQSSSPK